MNKKIKTIAICAAQVPFADGGAEFLVKNLVDALKKEGYEVELIQILFKWLPKKELIKNAIIWRSVDLDKNFYSNIDLVICTKYPTYLVKHSNKILWLLHQHRDVYDIVEKGKGPFDKNNKEDMKIKDKIVNLDNKFIPQCKKIFTISKNVSMRLEKFNKIKSTPLYNPPNNYERLKEGDFKDYLFCISRFELYKRIELIIEAMKYTRTKAKLIIAGKGPQERNLKQLAKKLRVNKKIEWKGFVSEEEKINLYSNCFSVIYAPYDEDYGYVTLEAFFSKKPVITTTDSGGPLEFVEHNKSGLISKPDPEEIAENIDKLFNDRELCKKMGKEGYNKVKDISWDNVIDKLID